MFYFCILFLDQHQKLWRTQVIEAYSLGSKAKCRPRTRSRTPLQRKYVKNEIVTSPEYDPFTEGPATNDAMDADYFRTLQEMEDAIDLEPSVEATSQLAEAVEAPAADGAASGTATAAADGTAEAARDGTPDAAANDTAQAAAAVPAAEAVPPADPSQLAEAPWRSSDQAPVPPPDEAVPTSRLRPAEPAGPPPQKGEGKGKGYGKQQNRPSQERMGWANRAVSLIAAWERQDWREMNRPCLQHPSLVQ